MEIRFGFQPGIYKFSKDVKSGFDGFSYVELSVSDGIEFESVASSENFLVRVKIVEFLVETRLFSLELENFHSNSSIFTQT